MIRTARNHHSKQKLSKEKKLSSLSTKKRSFCHPQLLKIVLRCMCVLRTLREMMPPKITSDDDLWLGWNFKTVEKLTSLGYY